jgi:hypothetical protein
MKMRFRISRVWTQPETTNMWGGAGQTALPTSIFAGRVQQAQKVTTPGCTNSGGKGDNYRLRDLFSSRGDAGIL